jgi:RNA polymerase sigma factor (sigma-70 family)
MLNDRQLLARYTEGSEAAFGELVSRYVNLVYSSALRRTGGDASLAQDAAQLVFTDLARRAKSLPLEVSLAGWLHRATRFATARLMRTERRRQARERAALAMNALQPEHSSDWDSIRPVLDQALDRLNQPDRDALLLRFFEQRTLAEIGQTLGSNEDAARKRVSRALEKLRAHLARCGVTSTVSALSVAISANALGSAPTGLATTLTTSSLASAAAGTGTTLTLLNLMAATKLKLGMAALVIGSVATTLCVEHQAQARLREQNQLLSQQATRLAQLQSEHDQLVNLAAKATDGRTDAEDLVRLRAEVASLREETNNLAALKSENRRLRSATQNTQTLLEQQEEAKTQSIAKLNYSHRWALAFILYADKHKDQFPRSFEEAAPYFSDRTADDDLMLDEFQIAYTGPSYAAMTNPAGTIVIREKEPRQNADGKRFKAYGFADGHAETRPEPPGGFEAFEKEHSFPVLTQQ